MVKQSTAPKRDEPLEGDAAVIDRWSKITDPREALRTLLENEMFLGYDPYYKDLRDALMTMAERCSQ